MAREQIIRDPVQAVIALPLDRPIEGALFRLLKATRASAAS